MYSTLDAWRGTRLDDISLHVAKGESCRSSDQRDVQASPSLFPAASPAALPPGTQHN